MIRSSLLLLLGLLLAAPRARAQTMLDQEQRLIEIHSLLLDLPPMEAPHALEQGRLSLGAEVISVPGIDGTTGNKKQLTASDQTPAFPRPRLAFGLPAPEGCRAFVGVAYVPPVVFSNVSVHLGAAEAGLSLAPGPVLLGVRAHLVAAQTKSPVTEPDTRDTLRMFEYGAELAGGFSIDLGRLSLTPYAGVGLVHLSGEFTVASDGVQLDSSTTALALHAGARALFAQHWEGVVELDGYAGRLVHPNFRLAYLLELGPGQRPAARP